jgi:multisubunit Na+/H+ antiporter MnhE subunit
MMPWLIWGLVGSVLWLLFAGAVSTAEIIAAIATGACAALLQALLHRQDQIPFSPRLGWFGRLVRQLPGQLLSDSLRLIALLVHALASGRLGPGRFEAVPFEVGGDNARDATRRALVTAAVSLPPNSYVVGIDREQGLLLTHRLLPDKVPPSRDPEWPL